jgi:hypothetical protein
VHVWPIDAIEEALGSEAALILPEVLIPRTVYDP